MRVLSAAIAAVVVACTPGEAMRPTAPTYAGAVGATAECTAAGSSEPLVVDWTPDRRADLEDGLRTHMIVVAYDCKSLRVLPDCEVAGAYAYAGLSLKEQVVTMSDRNEIKANLPSMAGTFSASLEASGHSSLDVALAISGRMTSTKRRVSRVELAGRCEGATHFVRRVTLGAFAMKTSAKGDAKAAVGIFAAAASGASTSLKDMATKEGSLEACKAASPEDTAPLRGCASPLRIDLLPVDQSAPAVASASSAEFSPTPTCPTGLTYTSGGCASKRSDTTYQCLPNDKVTCTEQCRLGHPGSCANLGAILAPTPEGVPYSKKACDADDATGCYNYALAYQFGYGVRADEQVAAQFHGKACSLGSGSACGNLAAMVRKGAVQRDPARMVRLYERACSLGNGRACTAYGDVLDRGDQVPRDQVRAKLYFRKGCDASDAGACNSLGAAMLSTPTEALALFERGCTMRDGQACGNAGTMHNGKRGLPKDLPRAYRLYLAGCELNDAGSCYFAGLYAYTGEGTPKDEKRGLELITKGCRQGSAEACDMLKLSH